MRKAALAAMSMTDGPAGSARSSMRRWPPAGRVVDRPVPAPGGAVVQAQLGQLRDPAGAHHRQRVLGLGQRAAPPRGGRRSPAAARGCRAAPSRGRRRPATGARPPRRPGGRRWPGGRAGRASRPRAACPGRWASWPPRPAPGAVASWAALKVRAKSAGVTRRWIWKAALAASATMPGSSTSSVSGPSMMMRRSGFIGSRAADRAR